jgi:hypothetical protein
MKILLSRNFFDILNYFHRKAGAYDAAGQNKYLDNSFISNYIASHDCVLGSNRHKRLSAVCTAPKA